MIKSKGIKYFKPYIIIENKYPYSEIATNPPRMTTMRFSRINYLIRSNNNNNVCLHIINQTDRSIAVILLVDVIIELAEYQSLMPKGTDCIFLVKIKKKIHDYMAIHNYFSDLQIMNYFVLYKYLQSNTFKTSIVVSTKYTRRSKNSIRLPMFFCLSMYNITFRNNASISNFGGGFQWQSKYPWCIIEIKSFQKNRENKNKVTEKRKFLLKISFQLNQFSYMVVTQKLIT
ncbi:hypothetical protein AGLY_003531, partial [Aphis glycines]